MGLVIEELNLTLVSEGESLVEDLSFEILAGETVVLCGPSGCGKTSVALAILDLLPAGVALTKGRILLDEEKAAAKHRGRDIGLIFQEPRRAFHPMFSLGELFAERLALAGASQSELKSITLDWLAKIGLENPEARLGDTADRFSGGELQRIMIAMALSQGPRFLIADEPTSNLDVLVQGRVLGLMKELQRELNLGILLITHDARVAESMGDRVVEMTKLAGGAHE